MEPTSPRAGQSEYAKVTLVVAFCGNDSGERVWTADHSAGLR
ncbi:hypothetical protein T06_11680 [Trichinella sp. T6]|nr:hypothetical protein T06_9664 [Trichinella sp. T6]KRX29632.1 hypothetical protein T06_11680 [Trichinella sp. T6]